MSKSRTEVKDSTIHANRDASVIGGDNYEIDGNNYNISVNPPSSALNVDSLLEALKQNRLNLKDKIAELENLFAETESPDIYQIHASVRNALVAFKNIELLIPAITLKGGIAEFLPNESDPTGRLNTAISKGKKRCEDSKGCYIASVCYGDTDCKQVRIFREYRDDVLGNSSIGRLGIRFYYLISPMLVEVIKPYSSIHVFIKIIFLNQVYQHLVEKRIDSIPTKVNSSEEKSSTIDCEAIRPL